MKLVRPRTVFAFMFYATACYLMFNELEIPQFLNTVCSTLLGFYYGNKKATTGGTDVKKNVDSTTS